MSVCGSVLQVQAMNILAQWDQDDFQNMMKGQTVDDIRREVEGDSVWRPSIPVTIYESLGTEAVIRVPVSSC